MQGCKKAMKKISKIAQDIFVTEATNVNF